MRNFSKVMISLLAVLLIFSLFCCAIIVPYQRSEFNGFQDHRLREELAGTLDCLIVGASNSLNAVDPRVMDRELGCSSYNLSGSMMTMKGRQFFLQQEMDRNPVKTVIMDMSFETFIRDEHHEDAFGDEMSFGRLNTLADSLSYIRQCVEPHDYINLLARQLLCGYDYWITRLTGGELSNVVPERKGFEAMGTHDLTLDPDELAAIRNTETLDTAFREENLQAMESLIAYCRSRGAEVILFTAPYSDSRFWQLTGEDEFHDLVTQFAQEQNCAYYDGNLLKNRYELFSDSRSFYNLQHMSEEGAAVFTEQFSRILAKAGTEDVSGYFYGSYAEMEADSPYLQLAGD